MAIPKEATTTQVAFLPPMSGLSDREYKKEKGEIAGLIGQGQTAQVLRNLCHLISQDSRNWEDLSTRVKHLFGVEIQRPQFTPLNAEITMAYREASGKLLDLSASGRGFQQTLLLLAHIHANPNTVLLIDEPDAHLEILRQRQTYNLLMELAERQNGQIIVASHSEVVLNEAADRDVVIAFIGKPHRIDDRGSQVLKSLREFGFEQYYQAGQTGWVLYLEGSTDLEILRRFAATLNHPAREHLEQPFVYYVGNRCSKAREHFHALREACPTLVGIALYDRVELPKERHPALTENCWQRREIENYLCSEDVLLAYARHDLPKGDLFSAREAVVRTNAMKECIEEISKALQTLGRPGPWSPDTKVTDDFLNRLFEQYFKRLDLPNLLLKTNYHELASHVSAAQIDPEVAEKLDAIVAVAGKAQPPEEG